MDEVKNLVNHLFPDGDTNQTKTENVKFFLASKNVTKAQIANQMSIAMSSFAKDGFTVKDGFDSFLKITNIEDLLTKQ